MFYCVDIAFDQVGPLAHPAPSKLRHYKYKCSDRTRDTAALNSSWRLTFPDDKKISEAILTSPDGKEEPCRVQALNVTPLVYVDRNDGPISKGGITFLIYGENGAIDIIHWALRVLLHRFPYQGNFIINAFAHAEQPQDVPLGQIHDVGVMEDLQNDDQIVLDVERANK